MYADPSINLHNLKDKITAEYSQLTEFTILAEIKVKINIS
jgi:hypothetical protein